MLMLINRGLLVSGFQRLVADERAERVLTRGSSAPRGYWGALDHHQHASAPSECIARREVQRTAEWW